MANEQRPSCPHCGATTRTTEPEGLTLATLWTCWQGHPFEVALDGAAVQLERQYRALAAAWAIDSHLRMLVDAGFAPVQRRYSPALDTDTVSPAGVMVPGALLLELQEALAALEALRGT